MRNTYNFLIFYFCIGRISSQDDLDDDTTSLYGSHQGKILFDDDSHENSD